MEKDKKLSAARKKLLEYKISKGTIPPGVGTTVHSLNEFAPPPAHPQSNGQSSYAVQEAFQYPPPPKSLSSPSGPSVVESHQEETHQYTGYPAAPSIPPTQSSVDFHYSAAGLFNTSDQHEGPSAFTEMERNANNEVSQEGPANAGHHQTSFLPSPTASPHPSTTFVPTPSAPPLASELFKSNQPHGMFTDAGQDFPVNFFQPAPVAQEYQPVSFNNNLFQQPNSSHQDFIYTTPQTPLFFNVDGNQMGSVNPPPLATTYTQQETPVSDGQGQESSTPAISTSEHGQAEDVVKSQELEDRQGVNESPNGDVETGDTVQHYQPSLLTEDNQNHMTNNTETISQAEKLLETSSVADFQNFAPSSPTFREPLVRTPTPSSNKLSQASQDEKDRQEMQLLQRMQSVQDALELQLEELRRDNRRLSDNKAEMSSQLENCEKTIQELRRERDRAREDAKKLVQPLHIKINALYEENQKILKNSSDVGMELRMKLQDKSKQFEEMEQAVIVVTKSKMDLAAELDQEKERSKELEITVEKQAEEIAILRNSNSKLEERVKAEQQKEASLHQLEDQRRHYQVQTETLQKELAILKDKLRKATAGSPSIESPPNVSTMSIAGVTNQLGEHSCDGHVHGHQDGSSTSPGHDDHNHSHEDHDHGHSHAHDGHDHSHDHDHDHPHDHGHDHPHDHGHDHSHEHGHDHSHDHEHGHSHDHGHGHSHDHEHGHSHDHDHDNSPTKLVLSPEQSKNPQEEMKRRLHHLEWENSTFRSDVEKLANDAKEKKQYEAKCIKLQEECDSLRQECQRLESLVIQLQGENDTIGDYIALYQSQRLALKESAKAKDAQLENLAREREILVTKMGELTQLLRELKDKSAGHAESDTNQAGHICLGHHDHAPAVEPGTQPSKEIEGKIMNLLTEISSSSLIENFHPCAVCSGRLMNV